MDPQAVEHVTRALGTVTGIGVALSPLIFAAVTMLRGMLPGASSRRHRIVLPLAGLLIGWVFVGLALLIVGSESSASSLALILLSGFWGYAVAAQLNAQSKEAKRP